MVQFYFLSVLLNALSGLILVYGGTLEKKKPNNEESTEKNIALTSINFETPVSRLIIGIMDIFIAFMKILSVYQGDVPVFGDFFCVLAGFLAGATLLIGYYMSHSSSEGSATPVSNFFISYGKYIGIACIVVSILHFAFPQVILL